MSPAEGNLASGLCFLLLLSAAVRLAALTRREPVPAGPVARQSAWHFNKLIYLIATSS